MAFWDALLERYLAMACEQLGCARAEEVWADGRSLESDDAVELARATS